MVIVIFLMPETQRKIVGNGSIPPRGIHQSLFETLSRKRRVRRANNDGHVEAQVAQLADTKKARKFVLLSVVIKLLGKFLDRNIKKYSAEAGREGQYRRDEDISDFSIEKARFVGIHTLILVSSVGTAAYGVGLNERAMS